MRQPWVSGIGDERWTEAAQGPGEPGEHRFRRSEGGEAVEVERDAEIAAHVLDEGGVVGRDLHTAGRRLDPHLRSREHPVQRPVEPEIREIGAERPVALRRELEVEGLGELDDYVRASRTPTWIRYATEMPRKARPSRARS